MDSALTFKAISGVLFLLIWLTGLALLWISMRKERHLGQQRRTGKMRNFNWRLLIMWLLWLAVWLFSLWITGLASPLES
jgi:hypothetical protein